MFYGNILPHRHASGRFFIYTAEPLVDPSHPDLHEPEVDDTLPLCTPVKPSTSNSNIQFTPENKSDLCKYLYIFCKRRICKEI